MKRQPPSPPGWGFPDPIAVPEPRAFIGKAFGFPTRSPKGGRSPNRFPVATGTARREESAETWPIAKVNCSPGPAAYRWAVQSGDPSPGTNATGGKKTPGALFCSSTLTKLEIRFSPGERFNRPFRVHGRRQCALLHSSRWKLPPFAHLVKGNISDEDHEGSLKARRVGPREMRCQAQQRSN